MPLGENSYSFLLANKICLQLRDMPNSDSHYKPWVGVEAGEGRKTRRKKNTVRGVKTGQDKGEMGVGDGFPTFSLNCSLCTEHEEYVLVLIF